MPRLLALLPCERLLIAQEDNSASVMAILQGFTLAALPPAEAGVNLPVTWYMFALWEREAGDDPDQCRQRFELLSPAGEVLAASPDLAVVTNARFNRAFIRLVGFPIKGAGDYIFRVLLKTGNTQLAEVSRFPIPIEVKPDETPEGRS
jgi:hypothetical protein